MLAWPGEAHGGGANRAAGLAAEEAAGAETVPGAGTAACATGAAGKAVAAVTALAAMLIVPPADIVQGETATGTECGSNSDRVILIRAYRCRSGVIVITYIYHKIVFII